MQAYELSRQPVEAHQTDQHPEEWSTARSINGTTSAFSLFRRRHNKSQTGSAVKYSNGDGYTTTKDGDASDSGSVASASTATGSINTQATNTTAQTAPPAYDTLYMPAAGADSASSSSDTFHPTLHLQIDAAGRGECMSSALFSSSREETTPVYVVDDNALAAAAAAAAQGSTSPQTAYYNTAPAFISLRKSRGSSSCSLVAGAGYSLLNGSGAGSSRCHSAADADALRTVSTTTYRWGPGRPPRISVGGDLSATAPSDPSAAWDSFEVKNTAIWSRRQRIQTRLGTFEWRYGSHAERKDLTKELLWQIGAGKEEEVAIVDITDKKEKKRREKEEKAIRKHHDVKCLLVLDHITHVHGSTDAAGPSSASAGGPREMRRPVVRFIRNGELRTPGSSHHSAGNGGRLQIDLRPWEAMDMPVADEKKKQATADGLDHEMLITAIVSSAICLLKKEVDRRKGEEAAVISAVVS